MRNLHDAIAAALTTPQTLLWFPDVTAALVKTGWQMLYQQTSITREIYGTARVYAGDASAPRHLAACIPFRPGAIGEAAHLLIECLSGASADRYRNVGLTFYTSEMLASTTILQCLREAIDLLASLPTLHHTIAQLVRICHLIRPEEDDYDVSYSDLDVPFSVCVSVPLVRQAHNALRVAEALVHEAMHLQLTLIERVAPLIQSSDVLHFSPWKGTDRPPQGVLHALYVFRVIEQYFAQLLALPNKWSADSTDYMQQRRSDITLQIREIKAFKYSPALTDLGTRVVQKLVDD